MKFIALKCFFCIFLPPSIPARLFPGHVLQADAIHRADRNAQLAARAVLLDHGVHHLVAAQNRIGGADRQAQRAAYAPGLVNYSDAAWRFQAVGGIQGHSRLASDGG